MNSTIEEMRNTKPFDVIEFAKIEWLVLKNEGDKLLIISESKISEQPYNVKCERITWEKSTLRKWLNNEFYSTSFTDEEKAKIIETEVKNDDNDEYGTKGGNDTTDKVFLLSIEEADKYFADDESRDCGSWWWLRSPGDDQYDAAGVYDDGYIDGRGSFVDSDHGIRPALWLNLKS